MRLRGSFFWFLFPFPVLWGSDVCLVIRELQGPGPHLLILGFSCSSVHVSTSGHSGGCIPLWKGWDREGWDKGATSEITPHQETCRTGGRED